MSDDETETNISESTEGGVDAAAAEETQQLQEEQTREATAQAAASVEQSLLRVGFVNFDAAVTDNTTTGAMVPADLRQHFRRDVYVGIRDREQSVEFLGRIVEGPFHAPHEVSQDSAITRTTVLHPDRTQFRPTYYLYGTIEVLGALTEGEHVIPTPTRPRPYSEIYIFPEDRLRRLLDIEGDFYLGHLMGYSRVTVHTRIDNKNFLPRNVGIFGTIGSGKSNTTQVLMEESLRAGWAVVAIDVEGEYVRMNEATDDRNLAALLRSEYDLTPTGVGDLRVYVPMSGHSEAQNPQPFKIPISELQPEVIADILEFSEPQVRLFGTIIDRATRQPQPAPAVRRGVLAGGAAAQRQRRYSLQTLIDGLTEDNQGHFPLLPQNIGSPEKSTANALRAKLIHLGRSGMLDWNATNTVQELPVDDLLVGGRLSVLDVSETDDRSRNLAIAYTLQALFDRVIETTAGERMPSGGMRPRVLVVIEEVHTFVSRASAAKMRAVLDNLQIISRRGRKRWMALALVSQQPGHVPDELFELANTRFIHQLKSVANLTPVKQTTGGVHEALWSTVPSLGLGQCLLTGAVFKNPLFVNIRPAKSRRLLIS
jgi:DNA helicase HerA-like ATPase